MRGLTLPVAAAAVVSATTAGVLGAGILVTRTDPELFPDLGIGCGGRPRRSRPSATATSYR